MASDIASKSATVSTDCSTFTTKPLARHELNYVENLTFRIISKILQNNRVCALVDE